VDRRRSRASIAVCSDGAARCLLPAGCGPEGGARHVRSWEKLHPPASGPDPEGAWNRGQ
jgi:hypothetical protein